MHSLPPPPRPVSPARVVTLLGMGTAVSLLGDSTLYTVLPRPEIAAQAGVSLATVGLLLGANRAVRLLSNGAAGLLYDRLPRRRLLTASLFLGALSTLIFALGYGLAPLMLSRLLWGISWSGIWVGGNAAVLDVSSSQNRGRLSGRYQMWFFFGSGACALFGGLLTDLLGFRPALLLGGILTTLAAVAWLALLPPTPAASTLAPRASAAGGGFSWPAALAAAAPMFAIRFVFAGVMTSTAILWLSGLFGDRPLLAGLVVPIASVTGAFAATRGLASLAGAGLAGHLSDRAGRRWAPITAALLAGSAGAWLAADGRFGPAVALGGGLVAALAAGGTQALVPAIAGDQAGAGQRGRILSVVYTLGDLGSALAPPLALSLLGTLTIGTIYRLCAALLAVAAAFAARQAAGARRVTPRVPEG